jgi:geranylgeranyl diphosphate synthase type II
LGAIAGGATEEQFDAACRFAAALGLAFQIRDDMLDVIGTQDEMGKTVGTDETKNTFVRLYGLEKCEALVRQYTDIALDAISIFPDNTFLTNLALQLTDRRN